MHNEDADPLTEYSTVWIDHDCFAQAVLHQFTTDAFVDKDLYSWMDDALRKEILKHWGIGYFSYDSNLFPRNKMLVVVENVHKFTVAQLRYNW